MPSEQYKPAEAFSSLRDSLCQASYPSLDNEESIHPEYRLATCVRPDFSPTAACGAQVNFDTRGFEQICCLLSAVAEARCLQVRLVARQAV